MGWTLALAPMALLGWGLGPALQDTSPGDQAPFPLNPKEPWASILSHSNEGFSGNEGQGETAAATCLWLVYFIFKIIMLLNAILSNSESD